MCDYSLHNRASRDAKIGDDLETTRFGGGITGGLCDPTDPEVAVCVMPGTELGFADDVRTRHMYTGLEVGHQHRVATFLQIDIDNPYAHHDAVKLIDGTVVRLNDLVPGQRVSVLQLPPKPLTADEAARQEHAPVAA